LCVLHKVRSVIGSSLDDTKESRTGVALWVCTPLPIRAGCSHTPHLLL
jgi:hypothetical protein